MVITRTTRNRFAFTGTWVRIPSSPFFIPSLCAGDFFFLTNKYIYFSENGILGLYFLFFFRRICKGMRYLKQLKKGKIKGAIRGYGLPILFGIIFACVLVYFVRPSQIEGESKVI